MDCLTLRPNVEIDCKGQEIHSEKDEYLKKREKSDLKKAEKAQPLCTGECKIAIWRIWSVACQGGNIFS